MKKIFYLIPLIVFGSCNNDDDNSFHEPINENDFKIESYHAFYGVYPTTLSLNTDSNNLVKFKYDNQGRLIKRIGDIKYFSPNSGSGPVISDSLFTDLVYYENKVKLTKGISYLGYSTLENESIITFDSQNRIQKKTNRYDTGSGIKLDTINFIYNNDKLVKYVKTSNDHFPDVNFDTRHFQESTLYYDSNDNLDSIVTVNSLKYSDTPYIVIHGTKTLVFENYDASFNPFKKLRIFDETFYRSLSRNNYRRCIVKSCPYFYPDYDYYFQPIVGPTTILQTINWNLTYNANGNWMYNRY
ncbi:hypothetical protein FEDK69T_03940 [Flavobacterium enshiense DK69]|uniref:YD repeat-containing protein n=1 Tax=Flavobacterium enshiense DK69 TaxID=1107311 RepID=V6SE37_9FLAO|nr:hypothetical protein [Flavobacterium enshiense]ESU24841.1 hypothetical protein FEDK69T_03940 [Flavobacterium enshiense DK69]KGO96707.1 hypothetical protein Q767_03085 [Flavobacterium enshiense DK69]